LGKGTGGRAGREGVVRDGKGMGGKGIEEAERAESREKGRECSTWIFVQKPPCS